MIMEELELYEKMRECDEMKHISDDDLKLVVKVHIKLKNKYPE